MKYNWHKILQKKNYRKKYINNLSGLKSPTKTAKLQIIWNSLTESLKSKHFTGE